MICAGIKSKAKTTSSGIDHAKRQICFSGWTVTKQKFSMDSKRIWNGLVQIMESFSISEGTCLNLKIGLRTFPFQLVTFAYCVVWKTAGVWQKVVPSKSACVRNARFQFAELVMHMQDSGIPRSLLYR